MLKKYIFNLKVFCEKEMKEESKQRLIQFICLKRDPETSSG